MKQAKGSFVTLDGEQFYRIENYDCMDDFFMTVTSSCDVWNFCWSHGGLTAGRKNSDHAIFPYYTADKVSDSKGVTGPYTAIAVTQGSSTTLWEPFAQLLCAGAQSYIQSENIHRSLYRNLNGTCIWFEETNDTLGLSFRQGWTSSKEFGLVRLCCIKNNSNKSCSLKILDGARNIMAAATTSAFQNDNSVLLDAYKKTDLDSSHKLALFAVSSVVTDKAEPSEGLYANISWFSTEDPVTINDSAIKNFAVSGGNFSAIQELPVLKGKRPVFFVERTVNLSAREESRWEQVFDTALDAAGIVHLQHKIKNRSSVRNELLKDIAQTDSEMTALIAEADGLQNTRELMTVLHHRANVMFNIMRGGVCAEDGKVNVSDYISFVEIRSKEKLASVKEIFKALPNERILERSTVRDAMEKSGDAQLMRLFLEYVPLTFSRRHGDPSRPWNRFNIQLKDNDGNPLLNYEGNWRDIFQNWEALAWSYPAYIPSFTAKFLNAMTAEGFNPYRITREGIDWETPDPENPWAQYGYWGDHQVIYLQKFLELYSMTDSIGLQKALNIPLYSSSNVPYRLKSYSEILKDPRNSIIFDQTLSTKLIEVAGKNGSDEKLVKGKDGSPALVTMTAKLIQVIIAKAANLVPNGGIWMNTQRPEWNDANNALAGWGLSVVTLCYLYRMLSFLIRLYEGAPQTEYEVPKAEAECFIKLGKLYEEGNSRGIYSAKERKNFTDAAGLLFEAERNQLYENGYKEITLVSQKQIVSILKAIHFEAERSIRSNKREDKLYHTYNTMILSEDGMEINRLQEMLEGQVAVLSSGLLSEEETLDVITALEKSRMYEPRQNSFMLYPNKELPLFIKKNTVPEEKVQLLKPLIQRTKNSVLIQDEEGFYHFAPEFKNERIMREKLSMLSDSEKPTKEETDLLCRLYEETFNHKSFTGRSGTFYAYEGLGSIYWHMVSKLLLAVQEYALRANENKSPLAQKLTDAYYRIRSGLSFNKTPEVYGAFPCDPYSHTPYLQEAKQPGMTGQVKEEILTRWGELGACIIDGRAAFIPSILKDEEFFDDGSLSFTWCGTRVVYAKGKKNPSVTVIYTDGKAESQEGAFLTKEQSQMLFGRKGTISKICVNLA